MKKNIFNQFIVLNTNDVTFFYYLFLLWSKKLKKDLNEQYFNFLIIFIFLILTILYYFILGYLIYTANLEFLDSSSLNNIKKLKSILNVLIEKIKN